MTSSEPLLDIALRGLEQYSAEWYAAKERYFLDNYPDLTAREKSKLRGDTARAQNRETD